jgi:hypothetical protein
MKLNVKIKFVFQKVLTINTAFVVQEKMIPNGLNSVDLFII